MNNIKVLQETHKFPDTQVINMDKTPLYFDMPGSTTVKKGCREVHIRSTGAEKRRLAVILACTAVVICCRQWLSSRGKGHSRLYAFQRVF